jgi:hypothetical protein
MSPTKVSCRSCGAPEGRACGVEGKYVHYCEARITDATGRVTLKNGRAYVNGVDVRSGDAELPESYTASARKGGQRGRR